MDREEYSQEHTLYLWERGGGREGGRERERERGMSQGEGNM